MNAILKSAATAALLCLAAPAFADHPIVACDQDPRAAGMSERVANMRGEMDRIEWTVDRAQQRKLMELHTKKMHESLRELRRRNLGDSCRMEVMQAMLEEMMRVHVVEQDSGSN